MSDESGYGQGNVWLLSGLVSAGAHALAIVLLVSCFRSPKDAPSAPEKPPERQVVQETATADEKTKPDEKASETVKPAENAGTDARERSATEARRPTETRRPTEARRPRVKPPEVLVPPPPSDAIADSQAGSVPAPNAGSVPTPNAGSVPTPGAATERPVRPTGPVVPRYATHAVRSGENFTSIARRYGVAPAELARLNGKKLSSFNKLFVGQKLKVPMIAGGEQ